MDRPRRGERTPGHRHRKSRFFHSLDLWYFLTREGTVEGPFERRGAAEVTLNDYVRSLYKSTD